MTAMAMTDNGTTCTPHVFTAASSNGVWQGDVPVDFTLPLLTLQICLVLGLTRLLAVLLKPLKQPRVIAEIIGGIILGPSALGHSATYMKYMFPKRSLTVLDTVANLGLIFFLFLVGLELDLHAIKRSGRQALSIAAAGISVPFAAGVGVSIVLRRTIATDGEFAPFLVFMGVALSITAFPVLARILAERKLLTTDVGQMAMSAAAVNDVVAWILLALAVALSGSGKSPLITLWVLLCGLAFVCIMFLVVKPVMSCIAKQTIENEPANELHVAITLAGVLVSAFATDAVGIHGIFGAFVFGLIIPKEGPFARALFEKIEDLTTTLMLPLYFASSGLKTNIGSIHSAQSGGLLVLVIATACLGKILGTLVVALLHKMDVRKSLTLGFLMNTKGLVELIVLNIGKDRKVLNDETFAIMVVMALFTTFITTPVVLALYKPARNPVPYSRRTLHLPANKGDEELRLLACVHGMPNVHAITNLIEASRGVRKRPLRMYVLHLLQLTERPSAIMKVQRVWQNSLPCSDGHDNMDSVELAFKSYGQLSKVTVQAMTAISNFEDMHEDICATAEEKRVALIVLPFHKHVRLTDGIWEGNHSHLQSVNKKVLLHAPCSVGILVDRGIGTVAHSSGLVDHNVAVLFFGGRDDREAVAFGYRMAEHPGVKLKVLRFVTRQPVEHAIIDLPDARRSEDNADLPLSVSHSSTLSMGHNSHDFMVTAGVDMQNEMILDEECLSMVREKAISRAKDAEAREKEPSIMYEEREVSNPFTAAVGVGRSREFGLLLVGRGRKPSNTIAALSGRRCEFLELGPVGDLLTTHGLSSLLVVQQYDSTLVKEKAHPAGAEISVLNRRGLLCFGGGLLIASGPSASSSV